MPLLGRRLGLVRTEQVGELTVEAAPLDTMHAALLDLDIPAGSRMAGTYISELPLPAGAVVSLVIRSGHTLVPDRHHPDQGRRPAADRQHVAGARGHRAGAAVGLPCRPACGLDGHRPAELVGPRIAAPGPHARPTRLATISADIPTSGRPPPGWADPPTRNRPGTGEAFWGRRNAARAPFDEVP